MGKGTLGEGNGNGSQSQKQSLGTESHYHLRLTIIAKGLPLHPAGLLTFFERPKQASDKGASS
jgi:hypothetical protein